MNEKIEIIPVDKIIPSPYQPRKHFDEKSVRNLAKSINDIGIIQPIVVRKKGSYFELVAGERRLEAVKFLGKKEIPAIVKNLSNFEAFRMTLEENIRRENLNPLEIAEAIKKMKEEFGLTDEKLGKMLNMSRPLVTNYLRLLNLPPEIKKGIENGEITFGHAKSLLSLNEEDMLKLYRKVVENKLSVRDTEKLARKERDILETEEALTKVLGTKVKITGTKKHGKIVIEYFSEDELTTIVRRLAK
ncbi:MAG: ParB/RepB/Spo0J family partition protein [Caldisericaceae bacterium]|nr:ParB/RepB/Spo0J family partition protein [Caldisericaceae bacterium]